mmetsp:Transcript_75095/g.207958  ORF Transcript_75095/g.207958 Transcript_75095/m.207958 type:complete len:268 (+) Transcript_75095:69-872(+)
MSKFLPSAAGPPCAAFRIDGFKDARLNQVYMINPQIRIGEQPTFWDPAGDCFMYYQHIEECRCWAICLAFDAGRNMLHEVQAGSLRGLAFELYEFGFESWSEYSEAEDSWTTQRLRITPLSTPHGPAMLQTSSAVATPSTDCTSTPEADAAAHRRRFLQEHPHVEEVLLVRGAASAKLLLRFRGARSAGEAAEVGRRLLRGRREDAVEAVPAARFSALRSECQRRRRDSMGSAGAEEAGRCARRRTSDAPPGDAADAKRPCLDRLGT